MSLKRYTPPSARMPIEVPGDWQTETEWPVNRTQYTPLYFEANGHLAWESNEAAEDQSDKHVYDPAIGITSGMHWGGGILPWGMPVDQRLDEARSLTYTTAPLESDLEVTGFPVAMLYVSSTADVAYFRVKLIDVAPDGSSKLVRYGGLSATHRNSHSDPEPLEPGKVYELKINLKALAYVFGAGHRIRVAIASADLQNAWPTAKPATNSIHRGRRHPSRIVLPVIPVSNSHRPAPDLKRLPNADPSDLGKPEEYSITQDLLNQTTTVRLATSGRDTGWREGCDRLDMQSSFTVSSQDPAKAVLKSSCTYALVRPEGNIRVEATEVTVSDCATFRHSAQIQVAINGASHFSKSWSVTVPRKLN